MMPRQQRRPLTLAEIAYRPASPPQQASAAEGRIEHVARPEPVLLVSDGQWLEVYGSKAVHLHVAEKPYMGQSTGVEAELLAEQYVESTLPSRHRQCYMPGLLRWQGIIQKVSPREIAERDYQLQIIKAVREVRK